MTPRASLRRDDAARLLGVRADADPATVRRAFRAWAGLVHPDHGGDARTFADLCAARDVLLEAPAPQPLVLRPRPRLREVIVWPGLANAMLLAVGAVLAVVSIVVGRWLEMPWGLVPAALLAAAWCIWASHAVLRGADAGHVIVTRAIGWMCTVAFQLLLAAALGIAAIEALPVLAVPLVVAVGAVNPGAGLWRTSSRG
jgi:hypothetical protein